MQQFADRSGARPAAPGRTVGVHRAAALGLAGPLPAVRADLGDCLGRALSTAVIAPLDLPPFDSAAMDGYALGAAGLAGTEGARTLPVVADVPAGSWPAGLGPDAAARIMTGAVVPTGADTVVQVEWTDGGADRVRIDRLPPVGANIRRAGEDLRRGALALPAGHELGPRSLALLAALGFTSAPVRRRPRVGVLATGSELVPAGQALPAGSIYESNAVLLAALLERDGAQVTVLPTVEDLPDLAREILSGAAPGQDLLVTSGGISAGAYEVVREALDGTAEFLRVAVTPGGPQGIGTVCGTPVLALPGNPVSTFVSYELFVRPLLRQLAGHEHVDRPRVRAGLAGPVRLRPGKAQFPRGTYDGRSGAVTLQPGRGSHLLGALAGADCLVDLPPGDGELPAGAPVSLLLLD